MKQVDGQRENIVITMTEDPGIFCVMEGRSRDFIRIEKIVLKRKYRNLVIISLNKMLKEGIRVNMAMIALLNLGRVRRRLPILSYKEEVAKYLVKRH